MKRNQWRKGALGSGSVGTMSPSHSTSLAVALLLISAIAPCTGTYIYIYILFTQHRTRFIFIYTPPFIARTSARARYGESVRKRNDWCRKRTILTFNHHIITSKVTKYYSRETKLQARNIRLQKQIHVCVCQSFLTFLNH